ncbi:MAG TPA: cytochrome c peroxidase [Gemmatimonadales bacterium]|nr:cytochrome c peroxidase [Gemmatimonadales bacterium]
MRGSGTAAALLLLGALAGCGGDSITPPPTNSTADEVRQLAAERHITALAKPATVRPALVALGQALAFDKELSGNRDISCMSCHLPARSTSDARSLSIGTGGTGLGPNRTGTPIARNSPAVFNLTQLNSMFWDGRVQLQDGTVHTPAGAQVTPAMQKVFEFGALSAQPMFPPATAAEMRGTSGNELAGFTDNDEAQIWAGLMTRLGAIPKYREMFEAAYPGVPFDSMNFAYASNAIAGFLVSRFAFNNSPWDRFLAGDDDALSPDALAGAVLFMKGKCSVCHNGPAFTDNKFHDVAVAQIGPGAGDGAGGTDDFGRMRVTGNMTDQYAFRTPPLRNVELTGPYGHDGAITDLRAFVAHYSESDLKLRDYDVSQVDPTLQGTLQQNFDGILAHRDTLLNGVVFTDQQIDQITAFMKALTDPAARDLTSAIPDSVPSGLPIDR